MFVRVCGYCVLVCVCSEAKYFRGGACYCGRATLHVGQTASSNLHCFWPAVANHHLALATISLRTEV